MILSCENAWKKPGHGLGIYVNEVTVIGAEDISGVELRFGNMFDIGIKLTVDVGRDFYPELIIAGNFKHDPDSSEVIGWGGAFVVQEALSRLGYTGNLEKQNNIPEEVLREAIGKRVLRLTYVSGRKENGKPRYSDWNLIATVEEGAQFLVNRFRRSLARGYPKNYRPELLDAPTDVSLTEANPF